MMFFFPFTDGIFLLGVTAPVNACSIWVQLCVEQTVAEIKVSSHQIKVSVFLSVQRMLEPAYFSLEV